MDNDRHITSGPWESDDTGKYCQGHVIRHNGMVVCRVLDLAYPSHGDRQANARLIAAAPELLDLLRENHIALPMTRHNDDLNKRTGDLLQRLRGDV